MKKKLDIFLFGFGFLICNLFAFVFGFKNGQARIIKSFITQTEQADAEIELSHYMAYRDIATHIYKAEYPEAQYEAELMASAMLDAIKLCLAAQECAEFIKQKLPDRAPEILNNKPLPFTYIKSRNMSGQQ